jgi:hypothetical protein
MRTRCGNDLRTLLGTFALGIVLACCSISHAEIYLVGFDLYSSEATGASSDDPVPGGYRWSSNSSESGGIARQQLTEVSPAGGSQTLGISFPLVNGSNTFTFAENPNYPPGGTPNPGSFAGVNLFFNDTGVSYNPSQTGIAGNLAAFVPTNVSSPTVSYPGAGVLVDDYGPGVNVTAYSGAQSYVVDGQAITVTALSVTTTPTGSITINVPEPGSVSILSLGVAALLRRRRAPAK